MWSESNSQFTNWIWSELWNIFKNIINKISWQKLFNNAVIYALMEEFPN